MQRRSALYLDEDRERLSSDHFRGKWSSSITYAAPPHHAWQGVCVVFAPPVVRSANCFFLKKKKDCAEDSSLQLQCTTFFCFCTFVHLSFLVHQHSTHFSMSSQRSAAAALVGSSALTSAARDVLVAKCYQQLNAFISQIIPPAALLQTSTAGPRRGRGGGDGHPADQPHQQALSVPLQRFIRAIKFNNVLDAASSTSLEDQRAAIRAAYIAMPVEVCRQLPDSVLNDVDNLLHCELQSSQVVDAMTDLQQVTPEVNVAVWQGDMSLLRCDAVVNPGNNALLGCFLPSHRCLDNILHAQSGPRLRLACAAELERLGIEEDTNGNCRVTAGFALPARYVFHTVGPCLIPQTNRGPPRRPTKQDAAELRQCYLSCLETAEKLQLTSIAFCCISTGIFGYPADEAASIAIQTCTQWQQRQRQVVPSLSAAAPQAPSLRIVFNVFKDEDLAIYNQLIQQLVNPPSEGSKAPAASRAVGLPTSEVSAAHTPEAEADRPASPSTEGDDDVD